MATRFKITQSKEDIIATGGIAMVGALLNDNRGLARVDKMTTDRIKKGWISNSGIIKSVVGLFTLARTDFADIELFRDELAFRLALELERVPSEETLRQRLDLIAKLNSRQTLLDYAMRDLLRKVESFGTVKIGKHKLIPPVCAYEYAITDYLAGHPGATPAELGQVLPERYGVTRTPLPPGIEANTARAHLRQLLSADGR